MANSGGVYSWSKTAALNASADNTVNYAEGQAPSSLNDSARAAMASVAKYRDDIAGAIVTTGTSTAYIVASNQDFDSAPDMDGQMIAFTPNATNTAGSPSVTLNVDGLGAKPLRTAPNAELLAGVLIQGTPYTALYNNTDGAFYLQGFYGNPFNIPLGGMLDFIGTTTPNSSFAFPAGQAISRTTYATLFAMVGTTYGPGDGSTTFNVIDMTGRIGAMKEASATRLTSTYFGGNSTVLGAVGGNESHTLTASEIPAHTHPITDPGHTHAITPATIDTNAGTGNFGPASTGALNNIAIGSSTTGITVNNNTGGGNPHVVVQPTIIVNKILRII